MSFQLEHDTSNHVQEHLNELTSRVTFTLFLASITTVVWLTQIDALLQTLLAQIDPCESDCLNLFDPAKWSAVRWMSAVLLGILTVMPIGLYQMWKFTKPGLLPSERMWMKTWILAGVLSTIIAVTLTIGFLFPILFDTGHQTHQSMELDAHYDPVHMLSIVIAVIWTEVIVACAVFAMMLAGILGMLNEETADWWRIRIYGLVLLLLLASLPEFGGLAITLSVLAIATIELSSRKWLRGKVPLFDGFESIMDAEGELRKILLVDCSCNNKAASIPKEINSPIPIYSMNSLCTSPKDRERILEKIIQHRLSDVILRGCSLESLPDSFKSNCNSLGCTLRELNRVRNQEEKKLPRSLHITEVELSIASLHDPWPKSKLADRIITVLQNSQVETLILDTRVGKRSENMNHEEKNIILRLEMEQALVIKTKLESIGVTVIVF